MNREGGVESCEVKGTLTFTANTDAGTKAIVAVNKSPKFTFATHPKVSKVDYDKRGCFALKGGKSFPVNRPVAILRWSRPGENSTPLSINCWPDDKESESINVNITFDLLQTDMTVTDFNILVPLGSTDPLSIMFVDGKYKCDNAMMWWHHDTIDNGNATSSIEFSIPGQDVAAFFTIQMSFQSFEIKILLQSLSLEKTLRTTYYQALRVEASVLINIFKHTYVWKY